MSTFDSFFTENPFPTLRLDDTGGLVLANPAGRAMLLALTGSETDLPAAWSTVAEYTLLSGERFEGDYAGAVQVFNCHFVPSPAEGYVNVYGREITNQHQTEAALLEENQLLDALMEHAPDMIFFLNLRGEFTRVNQALTYWLGVMESEQVLGKTVFDFFEPAAAEQVQLAQTRVMESARPLAAQEQQILHQDGRESWVVFTLMPWRGSDGTVLGTFGIAHDITDRKRIAADLQTERDFALQVMNAMGQGLTVTNAEGQFEYINPAYARMIGLTPEALIGRSPQEVTFAEDHVALTEARRQRQGGLTNTYETRLKRADGSAVYALITAVPRWRGTQFAGSIAVVTDLTERRTAEEALQRSEAYARLIVDTALDAVILTDHTGLITRWNVQAEKLFGWTQAEAVGHLRATDLLPRQFQAEWTRRLQQFAETGSGLVLNQRIEYIGRSKEGRTFPVELSITPLHSGSAYAFSAFVRDITDRKEAEATIQAAYDHLERRVVERTAELSVTNTRLEEENQERRRAEEQLRYRFMLESALAEVSSLFVSETEPDLMVMLGMLSLSIGARQAHLFLLGADGHVLENVHQWPAVDDATQRQVNRSLSQFPAWRRQLEEGDTLILGDPAGWPAAGQAEPDFLTGWEGLALVVVPIRSKSSQFVGMMVFGDQRPRTWLPEDVRLLGMVSEMVSGYLARRGMELVLEEERALLARRVEERTRDLSAANAELARTAHAKDEFLASMSHELRTPLNAILSISETLQEEVYGPLTERQTKAMGSIEASGRHLLSLINDILDLSKIEAGRFELTVGPVSVRGVCQASLMMVEETAAKKKLRIASSYDSAVTTLVADERRLKQMLVNLLGNAIKFTPEGGTISLEMTGDAERQEVRFCVSDTGPGIAPEDQLKLFKPFVQLDSRLARQHPGTGLGLALVYRMAELHGGGVALESEGIAGRGSRFTVTLPWATTVSAPAEPVPPAVAPAPVALQRVLLVDDSVTAAEQLARYLTEAGAQVTIHRQGAGVLYRALDLRPQVILLDLQLPDATGWEVLAQLKAQPHTRDIPVIIVSVVDEPARGLAAGAYDYFVKPVGRAPLLDSIHCAIRGQPNPRRHGTQPVTGTLTRPGTTQLTGRLPGQRPPAPRILVADDNDLNLMALSDYLTAHGYELVVARNGAEAVARAVETRPDLILMDIQMPGMDGLEATRRLRAEPDAQLAHTPIIALTALAMPGDRERLLAAGLTGYFSKPVHLKELNRTISALLAERKVS